VWSVFALRILIIAGIVTAVTFGVRFVTALRREVWGWDKRDVGQAATDVRQTATDARQDRRDAAWKGEP
jgi:ribosomal protein L6P/L9E